MERYRLTVEYDGRPFVGWQRQINGPSVQGALEAAGEALAGAPTPVYGAGRTDSGVHGLAMTAHIDLPRPFAAKTVRDALNAHLRPAPVAVLDAWPARQDFHARFSCCGRHYLYRVLNRRAPPALEQGRVWAVPGSLDVDGMREGAAVLIGRHDFTTFRSTHCQAKSPEKSLSTITLAEDPSGVIDIRLSAPSFLHNQVRSIVGTLVQVGLGRWTPDDVRDALVAKDRQACGPVAPAAGLYFVKADYPAAVIAPDAPQRTPDSALERAAQKSAEQTTSGQVEPD